MFAGRCHTVLPHCHSFHSPVSDPRGASHYTALHALCAAAAPPAGEGGEESKPKVDETAGKGLQGVVLRGWWECCSGSPYTMRSDMMPASLPAERSCRFAAAPLFGCHPAASQPATYPAGRQASVHSCRLAAAPTLAADKLDSMMELTLEHLQRRTAAGQGAAAWDTLLGAFERCVLLTHRSKFTQVGFTVGLGREIGACWEQASQQASDGLLPAWMPAGQDGLACACATSRLAAPTRLPTSCCLLHLPPPPPPPQFLVFFACRQSPEPCCRAFLHLLISRLTDKQQPPIARSACAAYAASFLARCVPLLLLQHGQSRGRRRVAGGRGKGGVERTQSQRSLPAARGCCSALN